MPRAAGSRPIATSPVFIDRKMKLWDTRIGDFKSFLPFQRDSPAHDYCLLDFAGNAPRRRQTAGRGVLPGSLRLLFGAPCGRHADLPVGGLRPLVLRRLQGRQHAAARQALRPADPARRDARGTRLGAAQGAHRGLRPDREIFAADARAARPHAPAHARQPRLRVAQCRAVAPAHRAPRQRDDRRLRARRPASSSSRILPPPSPPSSLPR